jgi:hypothetical protein
MAVGVASGSDFLYKSTGYAFIETTNLSIVGFSSDTMKDGLKLESDPVVIRIGDGKKEYGSAQQTEYIFKMFIQSETRAQELEPRLWNIEKELILQKQRIQQFEDEMTMLKKSGNIAGYNARVLSHNGLVSDYNTKRETYLALSAMYTQYAEVHNYILDHPHDRPEVYRYVMENMPA